MMFVVSLLKVPFVLLTINSTVFAAASRIALLFSSELFELEIARLTELSIKAAVCHASSSLIVSTLVRFSINTSND